MDRSRKDSQKSSYDSSKNLVGEQPGLAVLLTGFIIAFVFGYTVKSLISPARVTAQIEKAASHIDKNLKVQFTSAVFALSEGILPRFSVVITGITMDSSRECWMSPYVEIDELRLPISFWGVVTGKSPVEAVVAETVNLKMRSDLKPCEDADGNQLSAGGEKSASASKPLVKLTKSENRDAYKNAVSLLSVRHFNIEHVKYPQYSTHLLNFSTQVKSFEPRVIVVKAKTHLLKDEVVGDYLSHANLYLEYKESPEPALQAHFFGNWREGHYSIIGNYTLNDKNLSMETDLKHIPFSQILGVLKKYNVVKADLNSRQAWVSAKSRYIGPVDRIRSSPMEVRDIKIEGDLGELWADRLAFRTLDPVTYDTIRLDIKKLHIERLLEFLNQKQRPKILGHLGEFTGSAEIVSDKEIHLKGEHQGLEFIFANKGQREVQIIDSMYGEVDLDGNFWNFKLSQVRPRGGILDGSLKVKADRSFQNMDIKTNIDEIRLADSVQKLMTNGGFIGPFSFDSDVKIEKAEIESLKGHAQLKDMKIEGMEFGETKTQFDWAKNEIIMNMTIQGLKMNPESAARPVLEPVLSSHIANTDPVEFEKVAGQIRMNQLRTLSWKGMQGLLPKGSKLISDGSWDDQGNLKGQVQFKEGKKTQSWSIGGHRNNPAFYVDTGVERRQRK
jgi:hypothetical protein